MEVYIEAVDPGVLRAAVSGLPPSWTNQNCNTLGV
jgi:hypothetical protein